MSKPAKPDEAVKPDESAKSDEPVEPAAAAKQNNPLMKRNKYVWKSKAPKAVAAQKVGEYLEALTHDGVRLDVETIVNLSTDETSPLHDIFEWDNEKAGNKWRQQQAVRLMSNIRIVSTGKRREQKQIVAFVTVTDDKGKHFVSTKDAILSNTYRKQILVKSRQDLMEASAKHDFWYSLDSQFNEPVQVASRRPSMLSDEGNDAPLNKKVEKAIVRLIDAKRALESHRRFRHIIKDIEKLCDELNKELSEFKEKE